MSGGSVEMPLCRGCGLHNEIEDSFGDECARCRAVPLLRESYRRGFNAGVDEMRTAIGACVSESAKALRRLAP